MCASSSSIASCGGPVGDGRSGQSRRSSRCRGPARRLGTEPVAVHLHRPLRGLPTTLAARRPARPISSDLTFFTSQQPSLLRKTPRYLLPSTVRTMSTPVAKGSKGRVLLAYSGGLGSYPSPVLPPSALDRPTSRLTRNSPSLPPPIDAHRHVVHPRLAHRRGLHRRLLHGRRWPGRGPFCPVFSRRPAGRLPPSPSVGRRPGAPARPSVFSALAFRRAVERPRLPDFHILPARPAWALASARRARSASSQELV
jgi:hypothetical protein